MTKESIKTCCDDCTKNQDGKCAERGLPTTGKTCWCSTQHCRPRKAKDGKTND